MRFLLPILPFAFIMIGELLAQIIKKDSGLSTVASLSIKIFIAVELIVMAIYVAFHQRLWVVDQYVAEAEKPAHSIYIMDRYGAPHYSWFHGLDTKVILSKQDP